MASEVIRRPRPKRRTVTPLLSADTRAVIAPTAGTNVASAATNTTANPTWCRARTPAATMTVPGRAAVTIARRWLDGVGRRSIGAIIDRSDRPPEGGPQGGSGASPDTGERAVPSSSRHAHDHAC